LAHWRKSSRSADNGGACVEVADFGSAVGVRDSKDPDGAVLLFGHSDWAAFVRAIKIGALGQVHL
jgi:hypothetical protein